MRIQAEKIYEFIATAAYTGYIPVAPGTFGTLAALAIYVLIGIFTSGMPGYVQPGTVVFFLAILFFYPAIRISGWFEKKFSKKDPTWIVIDEVLGYFLSVSFLPFTWKTILLSFFIFRILDIIKPYPANASEALPNGWGVVVDDCISGIYTNLLIRLII